MPVNPPVLVLGFDSEPLLSPLFVFCRTALLLIVYQSLGHYIYSRVKIWYFRGRVSYLKQSEATKHCFLAPDRFKFETLPRKYRNL